MVLFMLSFVQTHSLKFSSLDFRRYHFCAVIHNKQYKSVYGILLTSYNVYIN